MAKRIPKQHEEVIVKFLTELFTGQNPKFDPTEEHPIPVAKLYEAIWKRTGWGKPPEQEAKKSNGAWGNTRTSVRHMLEFTDVLIIANGNSTIGYGKLGYYRPTKPEHYDQAYTVAYVYAKSYGKKAKLIQDAKEKAFPDMPTKLDIRKLDRYLFDSSLE
jgi:hypothetical protein